jgi:formylglycine-generating enzyme required for sulfatase activity
VFVNYFDAEAFAHWAGIRIPTEQEVEKSVRGTDGRTYPWGEAPPNEELLQWSGPDEKGVKRQKLGTSSVYAHPKGRSPFGILDAAGNVWVWTSSQ